MRIGKLNIEEPINIIGFCKLVNNERYKIPKGLYPIVYFEENSVEIAVEDEYDFMYIDRDDMEWIENIRVKI